MQIAKRQKDVLLHVIMKRRFYYFEERMIKSVIYINVYYENLWNVARGLLLLDKTA